MGEAAKNNGERIQVGTTGTIGSLITRELESMKHIPPASAISDRKTQSGPVSVPCGATPKKVQPRRNPLNGNDSAQGLPKNGHKVPMLSSESTSAAGSTGQGKATKKGSSFLVEVVDLKCNNPMSSRLKKLGFSKLSESVI
ncbi:unnamed protein product [Spirodela intermedia]|uniref:Uncharacterized protein n=2 Tax=Spirodela intermedia TaxID=51605 RepID=A0A7I8L8M8_SPIIN|nr:unnamed protein product [Spirodela intermedia]CAA6668719.1 unnamed protein product [Spirodela intermedia]CAA7405614.1 unnamed protein product [Spirodela intermedia]